MGNRLKDLEKKVEKLEKLINIKISLLKKINLKEDDLIILYSKKDLTNEEREKIVKKCQKLLSHKNVIITNMDISIIKKEK